MNCPVHVASPFRSDPGPELTCRSRLHRAADPGCAARAEMVRRAAVHNNSRFALEGKELCISGPKRKIGGLQDTEHAALSLKWNLQCLFDGFGSYALPVDAPGHPCEKEKTRKQHIDFGLRIALALLRFVPRFR